MCKLFTIGASLTGSLSSLQTMAEYTSLLSDLAENITNEDLEQLKSACKEDIPEDQSNNITSSKEWFSYLEKNDKLAQGERLRPTEDQSAAPPRRASSELRITLSVLFFSR